MSDQKKVDVVVAKAFKIVLKSVKKLQSEMKKPLYNSSDVVTQDSISQAARLISHELTKFALFAATAEISTMQEMMDLSEMLLNHMTNASCQLRSLLPKAGPTLKTVLVKSVTDTFRGIYQLVSHYKDVYGNPTRADKAALSAQAVTGKVWEACKKLQNVPITDTSAVCRKVLDCVSLLKDAQTELMGFTVREEDSKAVASSSAAMSVEEDEEEVDDYFDDFEDTVTVVEMEMVKRCVALSKHSISFLKMFSHWLLTRGSKRSQTAEEVQWLEDALNLATAITTAQDDMGENLYSPHEAPDLSEAVSNHAAAMLALIQHSSTNDAFVTFYVAKEKAKRAKKGPKLSDVTAAIHNISLEEAKNGEEGDQPSDGEKWVLRQLHKLTSHLSKLPAPYNTLCSVSIE